jgi:hypothetical protein
VRVGGTGDWIGSLVLPWTMVSLPWHLSPSPLQLSSHFSSYHNVDDQIWQVWENWTIRFPILEYLFLAGSGENQ